MRIVKFPLQKNGTRIVYPDDIKFFRNTVFVNNNTEIVAEYTGSKGSGEIPDGSYPDTSPQPVPAKFTPAQFAEVVGQDVIEEIIDATGIDNTLKKLVEYMRMPGFKFDLSITRHNNALTYLVNSNNVPSFTSDTKSKLEAL